MANPNPYWNNAKVNGETFSETDLEAIEDGFDVVDDEITAAENAHAAHLADTVDAHDASAISYSNATTGLTATTVQAAIDEMQTGADNLSYDNTFSGLSATNVQGAIDEVDAYCDAHFGASDPHTVYPAIVQNETISGSWTFGGSLSYGVQIATHTVTSETDLAFNSNCIMATSQSMSFATEYDAISANTAFKWYANVTSRLTGSGGGTLIAYMQADGGFVTLGGASFSGAIAVGGLQVNGGIEEQTYTLSGTVLNPLNGTLQSLSLSGAKTLTDGVNSGESMTLHIFNGDTYALTWPTMSWMGGAAPSLSTHSVVVIWKYGATLYGSFLGDIA